jgi:hypothetical protein
MIRKPGGPNACAGLASGGATIAASRADGSVMDGSVIGLLRGAAGKRWHGIVRRRSCGVLTPYDHVLVVDRRDHRRGAQKIEHRSQRTPR